MMTLVMFMNDDPGVAEMGAGILIFPILAALAYMGLYYLVRDKIRAWRISTR